MLAVIWNYIYSLWNILSDEIDRDTMDGICGEFRVTYKIAFGVMNGINGRYNGRWEGNYIREDFKETLWYDLGSCVFQESVQYQAVADMQVKVACSLRAGHSFSDAPMRWERVLTYGRTDSFCRNFCFMGLACVIQLFSFLESASFVRPD